MWQYIDYSPELYHHGILGQKWGVRRFQYADGTLTPAGRKRYRVDSEGNLVEKTRSERKAEAKQAHAAKVEEQKQRRLEREKETLEKKKERIAASRDPQMIYDNKDLFTFQELNDLYNVMQKEKQIKELIPKGETYMDKVRNFSKNAGDMANAIDNGAKFYDSIAKVSNSILGTDLPRIKDDKDKKESTDSEDEDLKAMKKELEYVRTEWSIEQNKENLRNLQETRAQKEAEKAKKKQEEAEKAKQKQEEAAKKEEEAQKKWKSTMDEFRKNTEEFRKDAEEFRKNTEDYNKKKQSRGLPGK